MSIRFVFVLGVASCLLVTIAAPRAQTSDAGRLDFLRSQDAAHVYALDSSMAFVDFGNPPLDPPYERGLDQLTVLGGLRDNLFVEKGVDLSGGGRLTCFALSPDGDTAVVGRFALGPSFIREVAIVRGLSGDTPYVSEVLPLSGYYPRSIAISPDGSYALIGLSVYGSASLTVISGLPSQPKLGGTIPLGFAPAYFSKVESMDFSLDGELVLVQSAHVDSAELPGRFLPRVMMQVVFDPRPGGKQQVSAPLQLPATPAIPPLPPYEDLDTGVALGDCALLRDGDSAIVPVSGAFELGQLDARIFLLRGVRTGVLEIARTLDDDDGVALGPFQVVLSPDCDRALITSGNSFMEISGLSDPDFGNVGVTVVETSHEYPAEPAITPDGAVLVINHPRLPIDGVSPDAAVTNYDANSLDWIGEPLVGVEVRSLLYHKHSSLLGHPSGLIDYVDLFTDDLAKDIGKSLRDKILKAIRLADRGRDDAALEELAAFRQQVESLRQAGGLSEVEAGVLDDLAGLASSRLD